MSKNGVCDFEGKSKACIGINSEKIFVFMVYSLVFSSTHFPDLFS
jgi:hypothetical protein